MHGAIERGEEGRPHHALIGGENYHALQLLLYLYEGEVDCIYIDPPYNTGNEKWKYNNRYVDDNDSYRHSKWLSMIEKRLRLAKRLLRPDGIEGYATACDFVQVLPAKDGSKVVTGLCHFEGEESLGAQSFVVAKSPTDPQAMIVYESDGETWGEVKPCS